MAEGGHPWDHHHLSAGLISFHDAMRFVDFLEAKHARWLGLEPALRHLLCDVLERHVGQRETGVPNTKLPKKVK